MIFTWDDVIVVLDIFPQTSEKLKRTVEGQLKLKASVNIFQSHVKTMNIDLLCCSHDIEVSSCM